MIYLTEKDFTYVGRVYTWIWYCETTVIVLLCFCVELHCSCFNKSAYRVNEADMFSEFDLWGFYLNCKNIQYGQSRIFPARASGPCSGAECRSENGLIYFLFIIIRNMKFFSCSVHILILCFRYLYDKLFWMVTRFKMQLILFRETYEWHIECRGFRWHKRCKQYEYSYNLID